MAMGQQKDRQGDLMVGWSEMPRERAQETPAPRRRPQSLIADASTHRRRHPAGGCGGWRNRLRRVMFCRAVKPGQGRPAKSASRTGLRLAPQPPAGPGQSQPSSSGNSTGRKAASVALAQCTWFYRCRRRAVQLGGSADEQTGCRFKSSCGSPRSRTGGRSGSWSW